jgi:hypothetical protein
MWGMVRRKGGAIEQAFRGDGARTVEDISEVSSYAMAEAVAAGDDRVIKLAEAQANVEKYTRLKNAHFTEQRTLREAIVGADIFLGLSAGGVLKSDMVATMAAKPLIFALANPTPEIMPEQVKAVRDDAVMATGRTDYPNQVNNVLCFPYIFRGALDCGATTITDEMEIAAVHAIADLAQAEQNDVVAAAYAGATLSFGPEYLIPKPFDPRLMLKIAPAVALAAEKSGVAQRPIQDMAAYMDKLQQFVYHSGSFMKPVFAIAKKAPASKKRIVFAEGEEPAVIRAAWGFKQAELGTPILVGREDLIRQNAAEAGLNFDDLGIEITNARVSPNNAEDTDFGSMVTGIAALMFAISSLSFFKASCAGLVLIPTLRFAVAICCYLIVACGRCASTPPDPTAESGTGTSTSCMGLQRQRY